MQNKTKDGRPYWVNTVITPLYDENKVINRFLSVRFDISNSVKTEMQLMESAKMASLGEMAGGIAHEINNPLAIIQAQSNQLFRHYQGGNVSAEKLGQGLKTIEETTARIAKIVHGLRSFSRDATGDPFTLHQVEDIVTDTLALCQSRYSKLGVSLKVVPFENTQFYCRPAQIEQILINLLGNALDAVEHLPQKWIELQVQTTETFILFRVTDSGAGIPDQVITNMMNPFFTTKPIGKGTGLGLSLSKGIAADHGGSIQYELYNGHTSFVLRISRALAVQNAA